MDDVKRYSPHIFDDGSNRWAEMDEDKFGAWGRHDDYTSLRARLEAVEKERDQWQRKHESQLKADFDLVEKYRRPKSGNFHFPEDVAHIIRKLDAAEAALATARRDAPSPMSSAPKDGTPVLVRIKGDLSVYGVKPGDFGNTHAFCGLYAVMRCRDDIMGWSFAAPVGRGGFSEEWLDGWWPLPLEAASAEVAAQRARIPDHAAWAARGRWREAYEALVALAEEASS